MFLAIINDSYVEVKSEMKLDNGRKIPIVEFLSKVYWQLTNSAERVVLEVLLRKAQSRPFKEGGRRGPFAGIRRMETAASKVSFPSVLKGTCGL